MPLLVTSWMRVGEVSHTVWSVSCEVKWLPFFSLALAQQGEQILKGFVHPVERRAFFIWIEFFSCVHGLCDKFAVLARRIQSSFLVCCQWHRQQRSKTFFLPKDLTETEEVVVPHVGSARNCLRDTYRMQIVSCNWFPQHMNHLTILCFKKLIQIQDLYQGDELRWLRR